MRAALQKEVLMRWKDGERSDNVEDRRGMTVKRGMVGGGIGTLILVLIGLYFGVDPSVILQSVPQGAPPQVTQGQQKAGPDPMSQFVSVVLADTEKTWHEQFRRYGRAYSEPKLVLFSGAVESACGFAQSAMGPFYCPADHRVYIDLSFFDDMKSRFGASGDFAQAYVIAHEVGHHVQNLMGISEKVQGIMRQVSKVQANQLSVRVELQADCFAGVWGYHADKSRHILESGDLEEALGAASAIGDDRIMRQTRGTVVPDAFTHGTSEQRVRWFTRGFESGDPNQCETFKSKYL